MRGAAALIIFIAFYIFAQSERIFVTCTSAIHIIFFSQANAAGTSIKLLHFFVRESMFRMEVHLW